MNALPLELAQQAYFTTGSSQDFDAYSLWTKVSPVLKGPFDLSLESISLERFSQLSTAVEAFVDFFQPDPVPQVEGEEIEEEDNLEVPGDNTIEGLFGVPISIESIPIVYNFFLT